MPGSTRVAVVLHILKNQPYGAVLLKGIREVLSARPSLEVEVFDPEGQPAEQVRILERLLARGLEGLIVAPLDMSIRPVLRRHRSAGVPVVAVDNDLGDPDLQNALVTADNRSIGRSIGLFMKEVMGGVGDIVEIRGIANRSTKDRSDGFREAIAGHPRMRIIDTCSADWSYDLARQAFEAVLLRRPRIDAVFAQNDEMARGALDAAAAFGRELEMLVTGVDAVPGALGIQLVSQGRLAASCLNPPLGKQAALGLLAVLDGEPFQKVTVLQTSMLRSNERIRAWQAAHQS